MLRKWQKKTEEKAVVNVHLRQLSAYSKRKRERENRGSSVGIFTVLDGSGDLSCPDFSEMLSSGTFCSALHADWI